MNGGVRSLLAFWMGGAAAGASGPSVQPPPDERFYVVAANDRTLVAADDRWFEVLPDDRIHEVQG